MEGDGDAGGDGEEDLESGGEVEEEIEVEEDEEEEEDLEIGGEVEEEMEEEEEDAALASSLMPLFVVLDSAFVTQPSARPFRAGKSVLLSSRTINNSSW